MNMDRSQKNLEKKKDDRTIEYLELKYDTNIQRGLTLAKVRQKQRGKSKAILEKLPEGAVVRSPGMKYKHYAPKADVTLLNGTFEQFKAYVDAHMDQNPSCLCFTGEAEKLGVPCVE